MQPILEKRRAKKGKRPAAQINPQYEWSYGAVERQTGESFFLLLANLQAGSVEIFLNEFAAAQGLCKENIAVLLRDGAPAHRAQWSPLRETVADRRFDGVEQMEEVLINGIRDLSKQKEYLSNLTNYDWLPRT